MVARVPALLLDLLDPDAEVAGAQHVVETVCVENAEPVVVRSAVDLDQARQEQRSELAASVCAAKTPRSGSPGASRRNKGPLHGGERTPGSDDATLRPGAGPGSSGVSPDVATRQARNERTHLCTPQECPRRGCNSLAPERRQRHRRTKTVQEDQAGTRRQQRGLERVAPLPDVRSSIRAEGDRSPWTCPEPCPRLGRSDPTEPH